MGIRKFLLGAVGVAASANGKDLDSNKAEPIDLVDFSSELLRLNHDSSKNLDSLDQLKIKEPNLKEPIIIGGTLILDRELIDSLKKENILALQSLSADKIVFNGDIHGLDIIVKDGVTLNFNSDVQNSKILSYSTVVDHEPTLIDKKMKINLGEDVSFSTCTVLTNSELEFNANNNNFVYYSFLYSLNNIDLEISDSELSRSQIIGKNEYTNLKGENCKITKVSNLCNGVAKTDIKDSDINEYIDAFDLAQIARFYDDGVTYEFNLFDKLPKGTLVVDGDHKILDSNIVNLWLNLEDNKFHSSVKCKIDVENGDFTSNVVESEGDITYSLGVADTSNAWKASCYNPGGQTEIIKNGFTFYYREPLYDKDGNFYYHATKGVTVEASENISLLGLSDFLQIDPQEFIKDGISTLTPSKWFVKYVSDIARNSASNLGVLTSPYEEGKEESSGINSTNEHLKSALIGVNAAAALTGVALVGYMVKLKRERAEQEVEDTIPGLVRTSIRTGSARAV